MPCVTFNRYVGSFWQIFATILLMFCIFICTTLKWGSCFLIVPTVCQWLCWRDKIGTLCFLYLLFNAGQCMWMTGLYILWYSRPLSDCRLHLVYTLMNNSWWFSIKLTECFQIQTSVCPYTLAKTWFHFPLYACVYMWRYMHACVCVSMLCRYLLTYITLKHTYMHTYLHTYTYLHMARLGYLRLS